MPLYKKIISKSGRTKIYICGIRVYCSKKQKINEQTYIEQHGENNIIELSDDSHPETRIVIYGNNNHVIIKTNKTFVANIDIGIQDCPVNGCKVVVEENTYSNGIHIILYEDDSSVIIHKDCLFSWGITIWCTDSHSILDMDGNLLNLGKSVTINEHVWVGMNSIILKNTVVPANCVIGANTVITKKFTEPNCVIAGNPGAVVKKCINWSQRRPKHSLNNM